MRRGQWADAVVCSTNWEVERAGHNVMPPGSPPFRKPAALVWAAAVPRWPLPGEPTVLLYWISPKIAGCHQQGGPAALRTPSAAQTHPGRRARTCRPCSGAPPPARAPPPAARVGWHGCQARRHACSLPEPGAGRAGLCVSKAGLLLARHPRLTEPGNTNGCACEESAGSALGGSAGRWAGPKGVDVSVRASRVTRPAHAPRTGMRGVGARQQAPLTVMYRPPRRSALQQSAPYKIATPCDTPLPRQDAAFTCWGCLHGYQQL